MKYTIISLNDERAAYKQVIRERIPFEEIEMPAVDGRAVNLKEEFDKRGVPTTEWRPQLGEAGVWLSNFDRWEYAATMDEPLIVFEDDAVPHKAFTVLFNDLMASVPEGWDFVSLWVPDNQTIDYFYDVEFNEWGDPIFDGKPNLGNAASKFRVGFLNHVALAYQGYGMVSLMYSPSGAAKLVDLARKTGVAGPVDCWLFQQAHLGRIEGYTRHPYFPALVGYDWRAATHVHNTDKVEI